jgi:hypothetical protein
MMGIIPDEDLEGISSDTLREAALMAQTDERFRLITPEAEQRLLARERIEDDRREEQLAMRRARGEGPQGAPASFEQLIASKSAPSTGSADMHQQVSGGKRRSAGGGAQQPGPNANNLTIIHDPDAAADRDRIGELELRETVVPITTIAMDRRPLALLSDVALVQGSNFSNLEAFLNQFYLDVNHPTRSLFWKGDIEQGPEHDANSFIDQMRRYCCDSMPAHQSEDFLRYTLLVENPVFVHCVFRRRPDAEERMMRSRRSEAERRARRAPDGGIKDEYRVYSWVGHVYQEGHVPERAPDELPPAIHPDAPSASSGFE